jgi:TRAP-type C4-dicarboxylate transport system substrate-binding protein
MTKSKISRRQALKTAGAAAAAGAVVTGFPALTRSAQAKKFLKPIVAGLNAKEGDPTDISIRLIPEILKEKYDVEMEIQIHPSSTLGTDVSQLEAVQTGFIDITSNTSSQFTVFDDAFSFVDLPYMIPDWDTGERLFKSDLWKQQAAKFESNVPIKVLPPVGAGGHRMLWNNKRPLHEPGDVNGLKFRSTRSDLVIELIRNWGGNPTPIPWVETYTAIQQGVVDGYHVQAIWTYLFKMHEVLKYATEVNASFAIQFQVLNANTWNSMPEDIQKPFMMAAQEAADIANQKDRELENFYKGKLREAGMEIYTPTAAEFAKWQAQGQKVWTSAGKDVPKAVVDAAVALQSSS